MEQIWLLGVQTEQQSCTSFSSYYIIVYLYSPINTIRAIHTSLAVSCTYLASSLSNSFNLLLIRYDMRHDATQFVPTKNHQHVLQKMEWYLSDDCIFKRMEQIWLLGVQTEQQSCTSFSSLQNYCLSLLTYQYKSCHLLQSCCILYVSRKLFIQLL